MRKEEERFARCDLFEGIVSFRALAENQKALKNGKSNNGRRIELVYYDAEKAEKNIKEYSWLTHRSDELGFELILCERGKIDEMAIGSTHGGLLAQCSERKLPSLDGESISDGKFYVMIEGIEDPYNFGYALRSLYAAGVDGVILGERNWMSAAGVVCRASAGASERLPMYISSGEEAALIMKKRGYKVVCADLRDSVSIYDADLKYPIFLIVGGEKRGISKALLELSDVRVRINYGRDFEASLSAASAATVVGYEIFRQNLK